MLRISPDDITKALRDLNSKSLEDLDEDAAMLWASRAMAAHRLYQNTKDTKWLIDADAYSDISLSHGEFANEETVRGLKQAFAPIKRAIGQRDVIVVQAQVKPYEPEGASVSYEGAPLPPQNAMQRAWLAIQEQKGITHKRSLVLEPNRGSRLKIQRYNFNISETFVIGTEQGFQIALTPAVTFRPQRVTSNAPCENFVLLSQLQVSTVNAIIGGLADAWQFNANGQGQELDLPTVGPEISVSIAGTYLGTATPQFAPTQKYVFIVGINGPATLTA